MAIEGFTGTVETEHANMTADGIQAHLNGLLGQSVPSGGEVEVKIKKLSGDQVEMSVTPTKRANSHEGAVSELVEEFAHVVRLHDEKTTVTGNTMQTSLAGLSGALQETVSPADFEERPRRGGAEKRINRGDGDGLPDL